jgi:hypothetical protein
MRGVLEEHGGKPFQDVMRAIDAAYPFGPRRHHPYKIWLDERRKLAAELMRGPAGTAASSPLAIACPSCGAGEGRMCRDIATGGALFDEQEQHAFHDARRSRDSGPLFAGPGSAPTT